MRAMNDAILIGIGTALADDPQLTCRLPGMASRSPVRVVLDADLRLPVASALVRSARETPLWVLAGETAPTEVEAVLAARGVEVFRLPATGRRIDSALRVLAGRGITRLMVEGGPTIAAALVAADLVDEAVLLRSPSLIGADGIDALEAMPLAALTDSPQLRSLGIETVGADTIETFERT
jgi:diaminohydroxyphosphoribosylaminopyrimidine deaminase/5-amino-6-(5-phosphoribosylamino)uracil reductase